MMDSRGGNHTKAAFEYNEGSNRIYQQEKNSMKEQPNYQVKQQSAEDLEHLPWEELQRHYSNAIDKHNQAEEELRARSSALLEIFMNWAQSAVVRDESRALKRFKTQTQHVRSSEEKLEKKKRHYADVVKAFENALALLND
ncbi:uncharacterized protein ACLA_057350 [Aspergillus clavatus NRRL 1]|uniref:Uncharacterized protein n=1 Tax=Aspergillus clavatus (strain ATCC 1007 / CBS 513.65 / DSM 816 / NCTC 3887 / NRRL 1 / QM 1276 / 107) TaxID=344612 RepID=A1C3T9_ASPCL|nr:uncharacterized protein ACLA_057350 [Aspergillus clavatus NRRL 1]EAW15079.1 conserved hypothetical protein [Aspergillus clavatus NRRL 1]